MKEAALSDRTVISPWCGIYNVDERKDLNKDYTRENIFSNS